MNQQPITVYGTTWCSDCKRALRVLDAHKAMYRYINIEHEETAAEYVMNVNNGNRTVPTIVFPDGSVLVEPSNATLQAKLAS